MTTDNCKLLIVDDDSIVRQGVVAYLEDSGFTVFEAAGGEVALELFREEQPDVVLTDLKMPGMDGMQLLEQIRQLSPATPVLVMSGVGVMGDVVAALRLGATDFLVKPFADMEVLVHAVSKSLERRDLLAENRQYRHDLERANRELRDHLRTLERDQRAGRRVQQHLLPPTPVTKGSYSVEHRVIPSLFLSGDFVDLAYTSDRYISFYLIDVAGHGASSAFVTIWMKHVATEIFNERQSFRHYAKIDSDLKEWLQEINRRLLESRLGTHMTCLVGVIDLQENLLHYGVAGHLPLPVLVSGDGAHYLQGKGAPLGLFPDHDWEIFRHPFPADGHLLALSDGILEVMPAKDLLEKEEYLLKLLSCSGKSLTEVCSALGLEELSAAPDDIAIVSIVRHA
ncbi:fused response regulator/phosphatase [Pseudomaricurvus sp. HS19]|uniref:fused response regulator/phosphatase n=1 Tax=Pseudomaricurvus sp. HS19 TaxID=2692626 RepID=UPI001368D6E4|nr:fused response regulator/phosphatase [Pseudomaricurvus sp. HS19]MYM61999.1 response regulator [Pseudomaricurvus sp. HS19]